MYSIPESWILRGPCFCLCRCLPCRVMVQSRDAPRALAVGTYQQLPNGDGNDYDTGIHKLPGPTPLLQMDADRCTKIVIFPRSRHFGGTVDPDQMVEEPLKKARRIFLNPDNPLSHNALERLKYVGEEPDHGRERPCKDPSQSPYCPEKK